MEIPFSEFKTGVEEKENRNPLPRWSSEKPRRPGYYWHRVGRGVAEVIHITSGWGETASGLKYNSADDHWSDVNSRWEKTAQWCGPLSTPFEDDEVLST